MTNNLAPYPTMKDSGVEWLGEVPAHWDVVAIKRRYSIQLGKMLQNRAIESTDVEVPYLKAQHVQWFSVRTADAPQMWASQHDIEQFGVRAGDLLVCEGGEGGRCGLIRESLRGHIIQNALHRLRPLRGSSNNYLEYVLSSTASTGWFNAINNKATIAHFTKEKCGSLEIPFPHLSEQAAIVRYLDYVERRIRRYVRAKQKLLNLLAEQKQVIIHRAVTRGLDPDVLLKPSGVEWLGEVPAHWEVRQLGRIGRFSKGNGGTKEDEVASGVPCVRYGDIYTSHRFFIKKSRTCVTEEKATDYTPIQYGDVLFAGSGETIEEIGKSAVNLISGLACCGGDVILFRPSIKVNANFFGYATDCTQAGHQKSCMGRGITIMHIYSDELKYMFVTLPPLPEQTAIVEYLDKTTAKIDTVIARTHREIELFSEYRTRLIADVVTGKVDVREAAAKLPDETDADDVVADGDANAELCMVAEYEHEI